MFGFSKRRSVLSAPKDQGQKIQMFWTVCMGLFLELFLMFRTLLHGTVLHGTVFYRHLWIISKCKMLSRTKLIRATPNLSQISLPWFCCAL